MCKHEDLQMFGLEIKQMWVMLSHLGVVGRGSETQLQEGEFFK